MTEGPLLPPEPTVRLVRPCPGRCCLAERACCLSPPSVPAAHPQKRCPFQSRDQWCSSHGRLALGNPGPCWPRARAAGRHFSAKGCGQASSGSPGRGLQRGLRHVLSVWLCPGHGGQAELRPRATWASRPAGDHEEPRWPRATHPAESCARDLLYPSACFSRGVLAVPHLAGESR